MAAHTIIGQVATGNDYFDRPYINKRIWDKLKSGSNILLSAPRRVGKTSLMYNLKDNPDKIFHVVYITTESINNDNEFFERIFHHLINEMEGVSKYSKIVSSIAKEVISRIDAIGKNITLGKSKIDYFTELINLIKKVEWGDEKLLIMLDEFSETIQNIIADEGKENAIRFLQQNRTLRQMPEIKDKVKFLYTGSIGLENIVSTLDASKTINDLFSMKLPPLTIDESTELVQKILLDTEYTFRVEKMNYLFAKIEWTIPFYIQLLLDEIDQIVSMQQLREVHNEHIDQAFQNAIKHRNYFENWHSRIRQAYKKKYYSYTKYLLNNISQNDMIEKNVIYDLAVQYEMEGNYKDIINALVYDGYINNNDDSDIYRFNSPLLKTWWYENVAS